MFSRFFQSVRPQNQGGFGPGPAPRPRSGSGSGPSQRASSPSPNPNPKKKSRSDEGQAGTSGSCQVDNSSAVIDKIARLYAERLMSDITLVINGVEYPTHRLILCASSDVFQVMLMNTNWSEWNESRVVLQESAECGEVFEHFLKYLYTGRLKLELTKVLSVLMLGDKYNVKDLIQICLNYMRMHIPAAAQQSQLICWFQYTNNFGGDHAKVASCCRNYLKWNLEKVYEAEDFPYLGIELFVSVLEDDDLVVADENQLYKIVEYWLWCHLDLSNENEISPLIERTMSHIRFPMMSPRQIADLIQSPVVRNSKMLMDRMALAMEFHNGYLADAMDCGDNNCNRRHYLSSDSIRNENYKLFRPRLYCTDQWSVCVVAPFDRLPHYQPQTMVFTTPCSFSDPTSKLDHQIEWCLDFFPKAVHFPKLGVISIFQGSTYIPEHIIKTVRLSVVCRSEDQNDVRVRIGVVIAGLQHGVEHVRKIVTKNYIFTQQERVLNLDDILPYKELNPCAECSARNPPQPSNNASNVQSQAVGLHIDPAKFQNQLFDFDATEAYSCCQSGGLKSCFLSGNSQDSIKLRVVITPLP